MLFVQNIFIFPLLVDKNNKQCNIIGTYSCKIIKLLEKEFEQFFGFRP